MLDVYIAIPYTHHDPRIVHQRYMLATEYAGILIHRGLLVYSPITHSHPIAKICHLPTDFEYWKRLDMFYIQHCREIHVIMADGWRESIGVQAEILAAETLGRKVVHVDPGIMGEAK